MLLSLKLTIKSFVVQPSSFSSQHALGFSNTVVLFECLTVLFKLSLSLNNIIVNPSSLCGILKHFLRVS